MIGVSSSFHVTWQRRVSNVIERGDISNLGCGGRHNLCAPDDGTSAKTLPAALSFAFTSSCRYTVHSFSFEIGAVTMPVPKLPAGILYSAELPVKFRRHQKGNKAEYRE